MDVVLDLETFTRKSKLTPSPSPLAVGSVCFMTHSPYRALTLLMASTLMPNCSSLST